LIELVDISKSFNGNHVLKGISSVFQPGEVNLVIGASGGGKSVLMRSMVGLIKPDAGEILYDNRNFLDMKGKDVRAIRRDLGMLFQGNALFDSLTVEQNVAFPLTMFSKMSKEERLERVNFCLKKVNLENSNSKFPSEISGGMKKRVGIARAISLDIKYLLCDEPNSGLDPITSRIIDNLLKELTEEFNITTIINSHDMKTAFDIGDNIMFLHQGHKWWQGKKEDLKTALDNNKELNTFIYSAYFK
jgi:phospholipid/cholesterol/gamma-HCH transport system ATP-binding protein